ncbi:MAG: TonB-dependent receptor, partial [Bacteroidetes bacterium]|nr:TonB-dependent receptor [Bacteroidota bacterium]
GMGGEMQNMSPEGILKGQILDRRLNQPMEYANFVLYKAMDSTIVTGTVTEADGSFKLEKLPFGRYYAIANFIGYNKTTFADIRITPKAKEVDLGKIFLDQATTSIEGVEIVADKAPVEFKIDKKIVNVSQDLIGSTGTAVTVLENIPSVQVDIEGNVTLRGSGSFTVLVDGKPSVLQGSDALEQIPASTIDHIEIITNPSAKYDPDGVGGIINVVLKKQKQSGLNGVINASVSTGNKYATDFTLNYRTKSINIFGGADMNYREFTMEGLSEYTYLFDTISHKDSKMEGRMKRAGYAARAGFDYYLTHNSTLTLSGKYGFSEFGRKSESKIFEYYDYNLKPDVRTWSETQSERGGNYYELNMSFQHNFDSKGHKFEAFAYFSNSNSDDSEEQNEYYTDGNWIISDSTSSNVKTSEDETEKDIRIKADYTKPIGSHGKLEAGFQSRLQNENEDFLQQDLDQITGEWINNDEFSSEITFKDNIHSVYGIFSNTWKTFGYQIGLRGEYTDREIAHAGSDKSWVIDQLDYFPSIHLSKEFQKGHQVLASYSRRIERPDGRELDPTPNYMNSDNIRIGNPALKPEYIDSYELSYQKRLNKSFLSVEGYYRINKNKITQLRTVDSSQINIHTVDNLNRDFSLGIEAMVNADFTKWLSFSGSVNLYDYRLEGTLESGEVKSNSTNWDGRGN